MGVRTVIGDYTHGGVKAALTMGLYLMAIGLFVMGTVVVLTLPKSSRPADQRCRSITTP